MRLNSILHRGPAVPLLKSARMKGDPKYWSSEKLERLLTPNEIDQVRRRRI
jgi:hypothetical protein